MTSDGEERIRASVALMEARRSPAEVKAMLANAANHLQQGRVSPLHAAAIRSAGLRRLAVFAGAEANDPLTRRWLEGLAAYEELTGRTASRTRPMLARHGARVAFEKLVDRDDGTIGFEQMIEHGLHDMTAEWIVLEFAEEFDQRIRAIADERLTSAGVTLRP